MKWGGEGEEKRLAANGARKMGPCGSGFDMAI